MRKQQGPSRQHCLGIAVVALVLLAVYQSLKSSDSATIPAAPTTSTTQTISQQPVTGRPDCSCSCTCKKKVTGKEKSDCTCACSCATSDGERDIDIARQMQRDAEKDAVKEAEDQPLRSDQADPEPHKEPKDADAEKEKEKKAAAAAAAKEKEKKKKAKEKDKKAKPADKQGEPPKEKEKEKEKEKAAEDVVVPVVQVEPEDEGPFRGWKRMDKREIDPNTITPLPQSDDNGLLYSKISTTTSPALEFIVTDRDGMLGPEMRANGRWDTHIVAAFHALAGQGCLGSQNSKQLSKPGLIVDVGANTGFHTLYAATLGCQVLSFEPMKAAAEFAKENLRRNPRYAKNVHFFESAASNTQGELALIASGAHAGGMACQTVPSVRLDSVLGPILDQDPEQEVLVLKIDTKGSDYNVLDGMGEVLKSHRVRNVVVEVWPQGLETAGSNAEELLTRMAALGYRVRRLPFMDGNPTSTPVEPPMYQLFCPFWLMCTPTHRLVEEELHAPWNTLVEHLRTSNYPSGRRGKDVWFSL